MSPNELMNIVQVRETSYIDEVNANLEAGWKLLLVYTYMPSNEFPGNLQAIYSLGWPAELGEPRFIEFEHSGYVIDPEIY